MLIIIAILLAIIASALLFGGHAVFGWLVVLVPLYLGFMALIAVIALCLLPWARRRNS